MLKRLHTLKKIWIIAKNILSLMVTGCVKTFLWNDCVCFLLIITIATKVHIPWWFWPDYMHRSWHKSLQNTQDLATKRNILTYDLLVIGVSGIQTDSCMFAYSHCHFWIVSHWESKWIVNKSVRKSSWSRKQDEIQKYIKAIDNAMGSDKTKL